MESDLRPLEERILRLEGALGWKTKTYQLDPVYFAWALPLILAACGLGIIGLGLPNHHYQIVFAVLTVALAYHQRWLATPMRTIHWILGLLNILAFSLFFKILIGLGKREPLSWVKIPEVKGGGETSASDWWKVLPDWNIAWQDSPLTNWQIDWTVIQTFLLLLTLAAALFNFQPFASLTAFLLVLLALPTLTGFTWDWVFWAIILASISIYLQSSAANTPER